MQKEEQKKIKTAEELIKENQARIIEWKQEHKTVKSIVCKSKYHGKVAFIIGKPTAPMIEAIQKYEADNKPHLVTQLLQNSCIKAGPVDLFPDDVDLKHAVMARVGELLEKLEVEEKEL